MCCSALVTDAEHAAVIAAYGGYVRRRVTEISVKATGSPPFRDAHLHRMGRHVNRGKSGAPGEPRA